MVKKDQLISSNFVFKLKRGNLTTQDFFPVFWLNSMDETVNSV